MSKKKSKGFKYKRRDSATTEKRSKQTAFGEKANYINPDFKLFTPAEGDNAIRILPPTWEDAEHYGMDLWVHYGVGKESDTYICPNKMENKPCPVCEEADRASDDGDADLEKQLRPKKRVAVFLVNRDDDDETLQVWPMSWTIDRDLCKLAVDKRSGEYLAIDDPEEGYDVDFEREGSGIKTKYVGISIARRDSPLDVEEALERAIQTPLPDTFIIHSYEEIAEAFGSGPSPSSKSKSKEVEMTWDGIHELDEGQLEDLIDDEDLDIDISDYDDEEEVADAVCEEMGISKSKKGKSKKSKKSDKKDKKGKSKKEKKSLKRKD